MKKKGKCFYFSLRAPAILLINGTRSKALSASGEEVHPVRPACRKQALIFVTLYDKKEVRDD